MSNPMKTFISVDDNLPACRVYADGVMVDGVVFINLVSGEYHYYKTPHQPIITEYGVILEVEKAWAKKINLEWSIHG